MLLLSKLGMMLLSWKVQHLMVESRLLVNSFLVDESIYASSLSWKSSKLQFGPWTGAMQIEVMVFLCARPSPSTVHKCVKAL